MDYEAFISYAHADGKAAAQLLKAALRGAYLDQHGNRAGGAWREKIQKAIAQSSVFFFLITPGSVTSVFCQQEWTWARAAERPIIPVRVEKVIKEEIGAAYHDFYETVHSIQYVQPEEAPAWQRYHLHLRTVYSEFERAIHFATQAVTFIPIPAEAKTEYMQREADSIFIRMVETPETNETYSLEEAWAKYNGRVLLLGDPGAGKTTMLLHHAQNLIATYVRDPNQRMPFYASIAQWDSSNRKLDDDTVQEGRSLAEWFAEQYKLPTSITRYIEHGEAVLILDGLDELGSSHPINPRKPEEGTFDPRQRFMTQVQKAVDSGNDVLITCRVKDYEAIGALFIEMGAVQLHHLNDEQIRGYLNNFPTVQTAVMDDADLLDICHSPLLLRLIAFGYRDAPAELQGLGSLKAGALRDAIFGQYITTSYNYEARRRADRGETMPFTLEKVLEALGHVAMINASGGRRNDVDWRDSNITENVLIHHDFTYRLKNDGIDAFCALACDLHILYGRDDNTQGFLHLLLRDHLAYTYSIEHLHDHHTYGNTDYPSPAKALGGIGDARAIELLINALANIHPGIRMSAAFMLGRLGDGRAVEPLINALADAHPVVHNAAASALGRLGDGRAVEPLINALANSDWRVRSSAAYALGELGDSRAVELLVNNLADSDWRVRRSTAFALGQLGESALQPLLYALKHDKVFVRESAAYALGALGDVRAVESLVNALADPVSEVRRLVTEALVELDDAHVVPVLIELLIETKGNFWGRHTRTAAARVLTQIGTSEALAAIEVWRQKGRGRG